MKEVYVIYRRNQCKDSNGYAWVEAKIQIPFFLSFEGANEHINALNKDEDGYRQVFDINFYPYDQALLDRYYIQVIPVLE